MMKWNNFEDVSAELNKVDWKDLEQPANVLADVGPERLIQLYEPVLARVLGELSQKGYSARLHAKQTHAKFYVAGEKPNRHGGHTLWVNDYRFSGPDCLLEPCELSFRNQGSVYVEKFHTHRHDFVSIQGGPGGFAEDRVSPVDPTNARMNARGFWTPKPREWQLKTRQYGHSDIMTIRGPYDIHRVYNTTGAITIMAQGPNQNGYSQIYAEGGVVVEEIPDIPTKLSLISDGAKETNRPIISNGPLN